MRFTTTAQRRRSGHLQVAKPTAQMRDQLTDDAKTKTEAKSEDSSPLADLF